MKNIVVVYYGDDWERKMPISSDSTRKAFEDLHIRGCKEKVYFFRASVQWFNYKKNIFSKAWAFRDGKWKKVKGPIKPDLIYDKIAGKRDYELFENKMKIAKSVKFFNNPLFRSTLNNKISQVMFFGEYMPASFVASDKEELNQVAKKIKSKKIVVKPVYGSGGFGIVIDEKSKALKNDFEYPVLVQEFIKSERGIPGFSKDKEVSDLRLVYFNHKLHYAISRIAKEGSLFTNFHQGATARLIPINKIPTSLISAVKSIIKKLQVFPHAQYSLDFIFDNNGKPYLVEMNTTPGADLLMMFGSEKIKHQNYKFFANLVNGKK